MSVAVSVIVPLAVGEELWRSLLPRLEGVGEVLLVSTQAAPDDWEAVKIPSARWWRCDRGGRAAQMNFAATVATGEYLWFVHADSRPPERVAAILQDAIRVRPAALHYFDLRFYDGGWKMRLNEWGVRWRCRLFGNPFGDQAFCLSAAAFKRLGGYDETAPYGEDHLLVLRAGREGVPVRSVGAVMGTTARRYDREGWWRTVLLFQRLWWAQWRQRG